MALDEYLFGKIAKYFKDKKKAAQNLEDRVVYLDDLKERLAILGCAVSGTKIDIYGAEREGGYKNNNFFLPVKFNKYVSKEANESFYIFRTIYLATQKRLNYNWDMAGKSYDESIAKANEISSKVLTHLFAEFPNSQDLYDQLYLGLQTEEVETDLTWLYGKWMYNEPEKKKEEIKNFTDRVKTALPTPETIIKAKAVEEIRNITVDKKAQEDYVLTHNFEKVETAEEFDGTWRDFDGDDDLESHQDALDEINLNLTVRVDDETHSVYQADFLENTNIAESTKQEEKEERITYPEWNYKNRSYREDYCAVYLKKHRQESGKYYQDTLSSFNSELLALRKMLANVNNAYEWRRRQSQGPEIDIDSVTDYLVGIKTGHTPTEKVYLASRKSKKDISILLLLDVSLSSDGYVDGYRILDIEKQIAILFGEILEEYEIDFSIQAFYSKTRNYSNYVTIKGFDDKWVESRNHIGGIEPSGYTRIGAAIRHSATLLNQRDTRNKWMILLSDGKPNDFDKYEGQYGINDVKQALREFSQDGLKSYALAVEKSAKFYLPQMFGMSNHQIVSSPQDLIKSLVKLYDKIRHS